MYVIYIYIIYIITYGAHRPLLLDDLYQDHVELRHEDALAPEDLVRRRLLNDQVHDEVLDPSLGS